MHRNPSPDAELVQSDIRLQECLASLFNRFSLTGSPASKRVTLVYFENGKISKAIGPRVEIVLADHPSNPN